MENFMEKQNKKLRELYNTVFGSKQLEKNVGHNYDCDTNPENTAGSDTAMPNVKNNIDKTDDVFSAADDLNKVVAPVAICGQTIEAEFKDRTIEKFSKEMEKLYALIASKDETIKELQRTIDDHVDAVNTKNNAEEIPKSTLKKSSRKDTLTEINTIFMTDEEKAYRKENPMHATDISLSVNGESGGPTGYLDDDFNANSLAEMK